MFSQQTCRGPLWQLLSDSDRRGGNTMKGVVEPGCLFPFARRRATAQEEEEMRKVWRDGRGEDCGMHGSWRERAVRRDLLLASCQRSVRPTHLGFVFACHRHRHWARAPSRAIPAQHLTRLPVRAWPILMPILYGLPSMQCTYPASPSPSTPPQRSCLEH